MTSFPFLSLKGITIDEALARRLPRHLAYYHRSLPIAQDGDQITVVMAYPDNRVVVGLLETILGGSIIPVRGSEQEIQAALDRSFPPEVDEPFRILNCVNEQFAGYFARLLNAELTTIEVERTSLENIVTAANSGRYDLTIMKAPKLSELGDLLRTLSTALLIPSPSVKDLLHIDIRIRSILCILRGHAPDSLMLEWAIRLASASGTPLSLLAIAGVEGFRVQGISSLLTPQHPTGGHVADCIRVVTEAGIRGTLKLAQGNPIQQIGREVESGSYDLLIVAAEAYGTFIQQMLNHLTTLTMPNILVVRPV